jgi:phospholipase C
LSVAPSTPVPAFKHVWLLVMENKSYSQIVGASKAQYLNALIAESGLAKAYQAVTHPSQPNYLALFSGSVQGVKDDHPHDISAPSIADQLEAAGLAWRVYAENVPGGCSVKTKASGGPDGPGTYARKHEPAISFTAISGDAGRCANIQPFSEFDPAAANFTFIAPNLCHDMHDCSIEIGDAFLKDFVPRITSSAAWHDGGVLFITWDEGFRSARNLVPTIVVSPLVSPGFTSATPHDHYSLLRTIQDGFGVPCLAESCTANTLDEFFQ